MSVVPPTMLPVHGFVLAGGKSSRMGRDKALLPFRGRPMVEIAVEKLRSFCAEVSIAGNRDDLSGYAPVVHETRLDAGPAAGIEAGLRACSQDWALFVPVDVPLISAVFLQRWAEATLALAGEGCGLSSLVANGKEQPAFCLLKKHYADVVEDAVADGERRVRNLLAIAEQSAPGAWFWLADAEEVGGDLVDPKYPNLHVANWFENVNTSDELLYAEAGLGPE